jgi:glycosyltransferase
MGSAKETKKVSIITAVYNGADYIEENILSVKNQDYPNIEHIIIDGGSKDGTVNIIRKYAGTYGLKWVSERDGGIYYAFNKGFSLATGEVYAWLDGDNYFQPGAVRRVADFFEKNREIDIVCGDLEIVTKHGEHASIYRVPDVSFKNALMKNTGGMPFQPAVFFKKEIYKKAGGFNTDYKIAADYDFWLKVLKDNPKIYCMHAVLGSYRKSDEASSQSLGGVLKGYWEMSAIGNVYHQPFYAKFFLFFKYFGGFISSLIKKLFK